jgi:hypothetical protein
MSPIYADVTPISGQGPTIALVLAAICIMLIIVGEDLK